MRKRSYIIFATALVLVVAIVFYQFKPSSNTSDILVDVESGEFVIDITTTGELEAKNSVPIRGPKEARQFRI